MRKRIWLRAALAVTVLLFGASVGISRALQSNTARRFLLARLATSFGRPVEVVRFDFSVLDGLKLEAHSVTIAEDPHFGNEYFLRADTLKAAFRWRALLAARFEFGSLSLLRPSLNLTRDSDGHWNIERWLPPVPSSARPDFVGPLAALRASTTARLYRMDVDGGRINFKERDDKIPFAFRDVSGQVNQDSAGRWQLDLEAVPMRAGVELQDIGAVRVRGTIAGTSARLQPAELNVTWRAASLADTLRLVRQTDYGMRGELSVDVDARVGPLLPGSAADVSSAGAQWSISAVARLTGIHGWALPERDADPSANFSMEAVWRPGESRVQIKNLSAEMPNSRLRGSGEADWSHGFQPQFHIASSTLGLTDILSWYRSVRPDVADDVRAEGLLNLDLAMAGWPLELQQGTISSAGATLGADSLPAPVKIGPVNANVSHGGLDFAATEVSIPNAGEKTAGAATSIAAIPSAFLIRGSVFPETGFRDAGSPKMGSLKMGSLNMGRSFRWPLAWNISVDGATSRTEDWLALCQKLAHPLNTGWTASGGLAVKMRGAHRTEPPSTVWLGSLDSHELLLSPAYVNQPVHLPKAHLEYGAAQQTITLSIAQAFGANWRGTIGRKGAVKQWTFDLTADQIDVAELDRWLGPRARPGFLERLTSFGSDNVAVSQPNVVAQIEAHGRLRVGEIVMAPVQIEKFDGDVELSGRDISVPKGQAEFFGGQASGSFDASLLADPSYEFHGAFDHVNLERLAAAVPFLNDRVSGTVSATLSLTAHGVGREDLIGSLEGSGNLNARTAELRGLDLAALFSGEAQDSSSSPFDSVEGEFQIHSGAIELDNFLLDHSRGRLRADGRIDFSHALNIRLRPSIFQAATSPTSISPPSFLLSGTIEDPKIVLPNPAPKPAAKSSSRGR